MFRWIRSEHKIRQKSWDPDLFRSGSVCGIWIRLKVLVLDLDPNGTCDPFGIWDPHGTQDLSCDLDPFETEPVICLGSGSEWTFVNPFVFWIRFQPNLDLFRLCYRKRSIKSFKFKIENVFGQF